MGFSLSFGKVRCSKLYSYAFYWHFLNERICLKLRFICVLSFKNNPYYYKISLSEGREFQFIWNFINFLNNHQIKLHPSFFCFFWIFGFFTWIAILIASSNISFSPSWVKALHSRYFEFSSSSIIFLATSFLMCAFLGSWELWFSSLISILFPINILAESFANSSSSGNH